MVDKGYNQSEFAEIVGVKQATISRYLKDRDVDTSFIRSLKEILNINPTWLLTGEGEMYLVPREDQIGNNNIKANHSNIVIGNHSKGSQSLSTPFVDQLLEKSKPQNKDLEKILKKLDKNPEMIPVILAMLDKYKK